MAQDSLPVSDLGEFPEYMDAFRKARELLTLNQAGSDVSNLMRSIMDAMRILADFYDADSAYILKIDPECDVATNAYDWHKQGASEPLVSHATFVDINDFPCIKSSAATEELVIADVDSISSAWPEDYRLMKAKGIQRLHSATFPKGFGIVGHVVLNNPRRFLAFTSFLHLVSLYVGMEDHSIYESRRLNLAKRSPVLLGENDIRVNMLGSFEIITPIGKLSEEDCLSEQCCKLIVCLLRNRDRRHSVDDIFEMIWPSRIADNPYESVKSIVHRTRKKLDAICPKPLMIASRGTFIINPEVNPILDTEILIDLCRDVANKGISKSERLLLCLKAMELYRGDLMDGFDITEHWLMTRKTHYRLSYAALMRTYLGLLAEEGRLSEMVDAVSRAQGVVFSDPQVQWQLIQIFMENKRYDLAHNHFLVAEGILTNDQKTWFRKAWETRQAV